MKKYDEDEILEYIKTFKPNVAKVLEVELKYWDDSDGAIGEHYIVNVEENYLCPRTLGPETGEAQYLVDIKMMNLYFRKRNGVKKIRILY